MTEAVPVEPAYPTPPVHRVARVTGWMLVAGGAIWLVVGLWAVLFVYLTDRGGTELVTSVFNLAIPVVLTLPGISVLRAGLARVEPLDAARLWRRASQAQRAPSPLQ